MTTWSPMRIRGILWVLASGMCLMPPVSPAADATITHTPPAVMRLGESVPVQARVSGPVPEAVVLHYGSGKAATSIEVPMRLASPGLYLANMDTAKLAPTSEAVHYFIELRSSYARWTRSDSYFIPATTVSSGTPLATLPSSVKLVETRERDKTTSEGGLPPTVKSVAPQDDAPEWVRPTLIGAGVLAVVGALIWAESTASDDDEDPAPAAPATPAPAPTPAPVTSSETNLLAQYEGDYAGTVTACREPPSTAISCETHDFTLEIDERGRVRSDTLHPGQDLRGTITAGGNFILVADVDESGYVGEVQYGGSVVRDRVAGSIHGAASHPLQGTIAFSGSFGATSR